MLSKLKKMASTKQLIADHSPEKIQKRMLENEKQDYLRDAVLGAMDGCVSSFAIVAGTLGGGFTPLVALALGLSSLIADGFSMAVSNYQATKSIGDRIKSTREHEEYEINVIPDGEREEIRQIFERKGFSGETLTNIVNVITNDKELWINTMLQEEHNLPLSAPNPLKAASITFVSFLLIGLMPLIPFFFMIQASHYPFIASTVLTGLAFVGIGVAKGVLLKLSVMKEAVEVLLFGSIASGIAYLISSWVANSFNVVL